jgi:outer membrane protein assembly factor BamB
MTDRMRLSDDLIRFALTPPDDGADVGLAAAVMAELDQTEQRRYWWTPFVRWFGPLGPSRELRLAAVLAVVLAILLATALVVGTRQPHPLGDGSMFHGGPARTGEMIGPGPVIGAKILWSVPLGGPLTNSMPALAGDGLYVADGRGNVGVFDAATGASGWTRSLPKPATSPAIAGGVLVVSAGDGVYGLDAATGMVDWHLVTDAPVQSAPAIVGPTVYIGLPDGSLAAVDLKSGSVGWRTAVGGAISRAPAVADGLVFAGGDGGHFAAVRAADGTVAWRTELGAGAVGSPAVRDGVVYAPAGLGVDTGHVLSALSASDGATRWQFSTSGGQEVYVGAVGPELTYVVSQDGKVYALRQGSVAWVFDGQAPIGSVASLANGLLYVSVGSGDVIALDASSGIERWAVNVAGDPGPAIAADGRLYVGTNVGVLAALAESSP